MNYYGIDPYNAPVRYGRFALWSDDVDSVECDECGACHDIDDVEDTGICPDCGADLDLGEDS